jgi:hypothetical protein
MAEGICEILKLGKGDEIGRISVEVTEKRDKRNV